MQTTHLWTQTWYTWTTNCYVSNIKPCRSIWSINRSLQRDSSLVQLETSCCSWSISRCPPADQSKHLPSFPGATWWCMLHVNRQITNNFFSDTPTNRAWEEHKNIVFWFVYEISYLLDGCTLHFSSTLFNLIIYSDQRAFEGRADGLGIFPSLALFWTPREVKQETLPTNTHKTWTSHCEMQIIIPPSPPGLLFGEVRIQS